MHSFMYGFFLIVEYLQHANSNSTSSVIKERNSLHLLHDTHANLIAILSMAYWFSGSYLIGR